MRFFSVSSLLVFLSGLAAGAALVGTLARAELSPPATTGMEEETPVPDITYQHELVSIKPLGRHPELFATMLEERSREGWELCAVTQIADFAIFKRAVRR